MPDRGHRLLEHSFGFADCRAAPRRSRGHAAQAGTTSGSPSKAGCRPRLARLPFANRVRLAKPDISIDYYDFRAHHWMMREVIVRCKCGHGCGLSWIQSRCNRTQKWAPNCPFRVLETNRRKRDQERIRAEERLKNGLPEAKPVKHRDKRKGCCQQCGGLPWRRPKDGICRSPLGCGGRYSEEPKPTQLERSSSSLAFGVFLLFLCFDGWGCSAAGNGEVSRWCQTHRCNYGELSFDPDSELSASVGIAVDSLNMASGLEIVVDHELGIPIHLVPETSGGSVAHCAQTVVTHAGNDILSIEIQISANPPDGCSPQWAIIRHEIGCHALNPFSLGDVDSEGHTKTGMCSPHLDSRVVTVDAPSLAAMCAGAGC